MGWGNEVSGFDTVTKGSYAPPNEKIRSGMWWLKGLSDALGKA